MKLNKGFAFVTRVLFLALISLPSLSFSSSDNFLWWWKDTTKKEDNFGDKLSQVIVERIIDRKLLEIPPDLKHSKDKLLFAVGSVLHFARDGDVIWGSGFRENPLGENRFTNIDVRAVRGPISRDFLLKMGIPCPEVYGDPALLFPHLFPEFKRSNSPSREYIVIPNIGEMEFFKGYKNVVRPTEHWSEVISKILDAKLVISSSLHGLIVAEAFGVPARLLKMTWIEAIMKYEDYYLSTGRPNFQYATG